MFGSYVAELLSLDAGPTELREQKVGSSLEHGSWTHITDRKKAPMAAIFIAVAVSGKSTEGSPSSQKLHSELH